MRRPPLSAPAARWGPATFVGAGVGLAALVVAVPTLYLVDLPAWVYQGALWSAEVGDARATPWSLYRHPVPNTLATLLPALLLPLAGPIWTGKAIAVGLLAAGFAAAWALASAANTERRGPTWARASVLVACVVVSSSFWNGYVGYQIGVTLALALGAVWLRGRPSPLVVAAFTLALFFAHAVPFAVVALALGLDALHRRDGRSLAALAPAGLLTAWYLAARLGRLGGGFAAAEGASGPAQWLAYKVYTVLKVGPFQHPVGVGDVGPLADVPAVYWLAVAASAAFVAALGVALGVGTARMAPGGRRRAAGFAWALGALALALPPFALNVVNPGERVLVLAAAALVAVVPVDARVLRVLGAAALVFLADDAAALWSQRPGLDAATREALYLDRAARERAPEGRSFDEAVEDVADPTPLLGHPVLLHSDLYDAVLRRDWTRASFDSGLLAPPPPNAPPRR